MIKMRKLRLVLVEGLLKHVETGSMASSYEISDEQYPIFKQLHLLTAKPMFFVANVDEDQLGRSRQA